MLWDKRNKILSANAGMVIIIW